MTPKRNSHSPNTSLPPFTEDVWVQCQLRLTLQFQSWHGLPLFYSRPTCDLSCPGLGTVLEGREGLAVNEAMLKLAAKDGFRDDYLGHLIELDHLDPGTRKRIAFNLTMDSQWEEIERETLSSCENKLPESRPNG